MKKMMSLIMLQLSITSNATVNMDSVPFGFSQSVAIPLAKLVAVMITLWKIWNRVHRMYSRFSTVNPNSHGYCCVSRHTTVGYMRQP